MITRARAYIEGGALYPEIKGNVYFTQFRDFVEVVARIHNLPEFSRKNNKCIGPFAFHIHNGKDCEKGTIEKPFPNSGGHYNPTDQPHGNHAGDFPVLMPLKNGTAMVKFLTDKFSVDDVINLPVLIHQSPDDYRTEPAGNSGEKIACGIIKAF